MGTDILEGDVPGLLSNRFVQQRTGVLYCLDVPHFLHFRLNEKLILLFVHYFIDYGTEVTTDTIENNIPICIQNMRARDLIIWLNSFVSLFLFRIGPEINARMGSLV